MTLRDRDGSFEPWAVKKDEHPELEAKVLSTFASSMGYKDIKLHVEEMYDNKISVVEISLKIICLNWKKKMGYGYTQLGINISQLDIFLPEGLKIELS